ncbi:MAG: MASE1 domain-containing protein, partial [Pseudomonadota bacterium]
PFIELWPVWAGGDFLGMIIGAPAALLLARFRRYDVGAAASGFEVFGLIGLAVAAAALIFSTSLPALFLIFPLGLLVVIRLSSPYTALMVMLVSFIGASATVAGHGPIVAQFPGDMPRQILVLQLYLATIVSSAIILSSVLAQRAAAQIGLRRALAVARAARRDAVAADGAK